MRKMPFSSQKIHNLQEMFILHKKFHYFLTQKDNIFIGVSNKNDMLKLRKKLYNIAIKYLQLEFDVLVQKLRFGPRC